MQTASFIRITIAVAVLIACSDAAPSGSSGVKRVTSSGTQGTGAVNVTKTTDDADGTNNGDNTTDGNTNNDGTTGTTGTDGNTTNNTGTNLTANITCPATTTFTCDCQTAADGQIACEPSTMKVGDWEHSGTVGSKATTNNSPTLVDCPQVAVTAVNVFRITCCYTVCGEYEKIVTAAACTKIDAKSFVCK